MEDIYSGIIIYLIGYSGVGKSAISKEIVKLTGIKNIDQGLVFDLIYKIVNKSEKVKQRSTKHVSSIWLIMLDAILDICRMHQSFVITDQLFQENEMHKKLYEKVESIASKRGSIFVPVKIECKKEVIIERHASPERQLELKSISRVEALKNCTENMLIDVRHPNLITIDVSKLSAKESAIEIVERIEQYLY